MPSSAGAPNEGSRGRGRLGPWPWLVAALLLLGGLTAIDVAFYRDDIQHGGEHEPIEGEFHEEPEGETPPDDHSVEESEEGDH